MEQHKSEVDLGVSLARVTEVAAIESSVYLGRGDKNIADQAAVDGMRRMFDSIPICGEVVIGEGEMDEAPMLYIGEKVGRQFADDKCYDIAVDPLDGTNCIAKGKQNAIAVVAVAEKGGLLHAPDIYMLKMAVGPKCRGVIDLNVSLTQNLRNVARALKKDISDVTVLTLDRERHQKAIEEMRSIGCRIKLFDEGDIAAAIATCFESTGVDMLYGIGGAPEGVISAAAIKCMDGDFQAKLMPSCEEEVERCHKMGITDLNKVLTMDDLVSGNDVYFAATGVTHSDLLKGVIYLGNNVVTTHTVIMRSKTGTIRFIEAYHNLNKKAKYFKHSH